MKVGGEVRWPLALATPQGSDMMVRIGTDFDTPLAIDRYFIGFRTPMLHAPSGLCYLAFCEDDKRASILDLVKRTGAVSDQPRDWEAQLDYTLEQIRRQGFCHIRFAQYREGGLAVPVFADNRAVGGLVMRYIKSTMKAPQLEEHFVPIVKKLAADISAAYDRRLHQAELAAAETVPTALDDIFPVGPAPFKLPLNTPPPQHAALGYGMHRAVG
jgi:IclR family mhp operon transcriptional activator